MDYKKKTTSSLSKDLNLDYSQTRPSKAGVRNQKQKNAIPLNTLLN